MKDFIVRLIVLAYFALVIATWAPAADNNLLAPIDLAVIESRELLPRTPTLAPARCDCGCESEALCDCQSCPNKLHSVMTPTGVAETAGSVARVRQSFSSTTSKQSSTDRAGFGNPPARSIYDSTGAPVVPAPVPDMLALGDSPKLQAAPRNIQAVPIPSSAVIPAAAPPAQQGYWARSCSGGSCSMQWVPAGRAATTQQTYQPRRRGFIFRRW